jgi:hypothetical protein
MVSIAPVDTVEILVNGEVVHTEVSLKSFAAQSGQQARPIDPPRLIVDAQVPVPLGGWVAARATGPKSKYLGDDYAFAQTSPVYVVRGGRRFIKASDVQFLSDTVDAIWTRVERWRLRCALDQQQLAVRQHIHAVNPRAQPLWRRQFHRRAAVEGGAGHDHFGDIHIAPAAEE